MRKLFLVLSVVIALAGSACWRAKSGDANANANATAEALPQYADAATALADGTKFLDEGDINKAIDALDQAVKLDPNLAEAWFKLGIAHALEEKRDETLVANEETPANKEGRTKSNSEKAFEKAVAAYKKIIDANPEDDVAFFNLGRAYNKLNEDDDAARALRQAVKLKPEDTDYQTELGAILIKLAQYQEAIGPLKKALEIDPDNIRAQELLDDAEAGRRRVTYSSPSNSNANKSANSNTNSNTSSNTSKPPIDENKPTPTPPPAPPARPRPSPTRSGE